MIVGSIPVHEYFATAFGVEFNLATLTMASVVPPWFLGDLPVTVNKWLISTVNLLP